MLVSSGPGDHVLTFGYHAVPQRRPGRDRLVQGLAAAAALRAARRAADAVRLRLEAGVAALGYMATRLLRDLRR